MKKVIRVYPYPNMTVTVIQKRKDLTSCGMNLNQLINEVSNKTMDQNLEQNIIERLEDMRADYRLALKEMKSVQAKIDKLEDSLLDLRCGSLSQVDIETLISEANDEHKS